MDSGADDPVERERPVEIFMGPQPPVEKIATADFA